MNLLTLALLSLAATSSQSLAYFSPDKVFTDVEVKEEAVVNPSSPAAAPTMAETSSTQPETLAQEEEIPPTSQPTALAREEESSTASAFPWGILTLAVAFALVLGSYALLQWRRSLPPQA